MGFAVSGPQLQNGQLCAPKPGKKGNKVENDTETVKDIFSCALIQIPTGKTQVCSFIASSSPWGKRVTEVRERLLLATEPSPSPSPPSPAPGPGSQGCYCWRRQDKSPRASLGKEGGEMKRVLAPWRGNKKCRKKPELRIQSTAQLPPLAFPSRMCTNTSCGRGFSSAAREIKGIPASWGGSSAWCEAVPAPGQQQKGHRSHSAQPGLLPPALGDTGLGTTSNQCSFRWAMRKSHEDLSPAWNSCANDGRKTQRQVRAEGRGSIQGTQQ